MAGWSERLTDVLNRSGCQVRVVKVARLQALREEIARLHAEGAFGAEFYEQELSWLEYDASRLPGAGSVIIVAAPQPAFRLTFHRRGALGAVILPPTYAFYEVDRKLEALVELALEGEPHSLSMIHPPLKLLAARSALSRYGRNNITYVEGMGSFNRLVAWATDLTVSEDSWREAERMSECDHCKRCLDACPTGCIEAGRRMVHAEACMTHINESGEPFPEWVDSAWVNAMMGCMSCQAACPRNRPYLEPVDWEDAFDEEETALLLGRAPLESLPERAREALKKLSMLRYYETGALSRNLGILLSRESA
jgi:epoxyqueuosine reductase